MSDRIVQQPASTSRQKQFSELPSAEMERSTFDMSHAWKGTMDYNRLVPVLLQEILPGDTFSCRSTVFMRLATPLKPIMDSIKADIHYFFVPNRIVWDNWQFFMGERANPDDDPTEKSVPQVRLDMEGERAGNSITDYFGLPLGEQDPAPEDRLLVNALPFRGYQTIFNEWYRNQNLQGDIDVYTGDDTIDGDDFQGGISAVRFRHKRADYFTRALPWPQKGDPVFLPLGTYAEVHPGRTPIPGANHEPLFQQRDVPGNTGPLQLRTGDGDEVHFGGSGNVDDNLDWSIPRLHADLTEATAATINDLRTAFQVQKLLERDARSGTRYIEIILAHFNVQSPDARLQRPEYLGGGSGNIIINPVAATVAQEDIPQGNLSAVGTGIVKGSFKHSFVEHGFLFGILSGRADLTYQNGVDRFWNRETRYDYYWPALSHLGEQEILNQELYWDDLDDVTNKQTWGYQERYAEYRYQPSRITGKFRSNVNASLDVWHLAQDFDELPVLNSLFTIENAPLDRCIAVPSEPHFLVDCWHEISATRPMPVYAVPGLVDHF